METQTISASAVIPAPPDRLYEIVADYKNGHPRILPKPYFLSLDVDEGGVGAGTVVSFQMRTLGRTRSFRAVISEPEPGRQLVETDTPNGVVTTYSFDPLENGNATRMTISTQLKTRPGFAGRVEGYMAKTMLTRIYKQELGLLAGAAKE